MGRRILLVDGDAAFTSSMAAALAAAGHAVETAPDGARALESGLSGKPDVVVTNYHLPVFSGERLRSFLRSNPTTFHIPFVFLLDQDRAADASLAGLGRDTVLVKPLQADHLLHRVEEACSAPRVEAKPSRSSETGVEGNLSDVSLTDLVQIFALNRRTGILAVTHSEEGKVFFRDGGVVSCQVGEVRGEKAFFRLLQWKEGAFRYTPTPVTVSRDISRSPDALLMEGLRQLDEWEALRGKLPRPDQRLALAKDPDTLPRDLRPVTQEVLLLLEFYDRMDDLVNKCSYSDYEIVKTVVGLIQKGIVEVASGSHEAPRPAGPLLAPEQAVRIASALPRDELSPVGYETGRILLLADPPELVRPFLARTGELPEFHLSRDNFSNQEVLASSFGAVGRLDISENAHLLLFLLPCRADYSPVWRPFTEGALGAIILRQPGEEGPGPRLAREILAGRLRLPLLTVETSPAREASPAQALVAFFQLLLPPGAAA